MHTLRCSKLKTNKGIFHPSFFFFNLEMKTFCDSAIFLYFSLLFNDFYDSFWFQWIQFETHQNPDILTMTSINIRRRPDKKVTSDRNWNSESCQQKKNNAGTLYWNQVMTLWTSKLIGFDISTLGILLVVTFLEHFEILGGYWKLYWQYI